MIIVGTASLETERAEKEPPQSFSSFRLSVIPLAPGRRVVPWIHYTVSCKSCGQTGFHVGAFPVVAPDPSPYQSVAPGETLLRPPHRLKCASCGEVGTIFDARTDGYDGILNNGSAYASGETGEVFSDDVRNIVVAATYNIDIEELEQLAAQAGDGVKPTDLFDWFNLISTPVAGGEPLELSYECA